jgi:hypothetical protein
MIHNDVLHLFALPILTTGTGEPLPCAILDEGDSTASLWAARETPCRMRARRASWKSAKTIGRGRYHPLPCMIPIAD